MLIYRKKMIINILITDNRLIIAYGR